MSIASHIEHLQTKHAELEQSLAAEMNSPAADFFAIKDIKKQKLLIKEEIARLEHTMAELRKDAS